MFRRRPKSLSTDVQAAASAGQPPRTATGGSISDGAPGDDVGGSGRHREDGAVGIYASPGTRSLGHRASRLTRQVEEAEYAVTWPTVVASAAVRPPSERHWPRCLHFVGYSQGGMFCYPGRGTGVRRIIAWSRSARRWLPSALPMGSARGI